MPWLAGTKEAGRSGGLPTTTSLIDSFYLSGSPTTAIGQRWAPHVVTLTWWDGTTEHTATLAGWWDGTTIQPATVEGWWDGSTIQYLT